MKKNIEQWAVDFFSELFMGQHHIPGSEKSIQHYGSGYCLNYRSGSLSTFDSDKLTRLVLMSHRDCIRSEIIGSSAGTIKIALWKRSKRHGRIDEKHPRIEEAIEKFSWVGCNSPEFVYKTLKALSIRQPWAWLIVNGYKDIENRSWTTKYRGKILVHAGKKKPTWKEWFCYRKMLKKDFGINLPVINEMDYGGVIGETEIVDCVRESSSPWFEDGSNGLVLRNSKPLDFFECKGRLSFFEIDIQSVS